MANPRSARQGALWCLVGKDKLLTRRVALPHLDRSALLVPRVPYASELEFREKIEEMLAGLGLNATRHPLVELGDVLAGDEGGQSVRLVAMAFPSLPGRLPSPYALASLTGDGAANQSPTQASDALAWAGAHLYFSSPASKGKPQDYELLATLSTLLLKGDYFNSWFPEASRELDALGLCLSLDLDDPQQPILRAEGRAAILPEELVAARGRLLDLGRHVRGRFWVTEIVDGEEHVRDFADPATQATVAASFSGGRALLMD